MEAGMINTADASRIVGVTPSTLLEYAALHRWPSEKRTHDKGYGWINVYRIEDVHAYRDVRIARYERTTDARPEKWDYIRKLVKWANGLKKWPSDAQIEKWMNTEFGRKNIEGIIDTRVFRKDAEGEYFVSLREPVMRRCDNR